MPVRPELADLFAIGYAPENRAPVWAWGRDEVKLRESPYGKRFAIEETPWLKEPLECLPDNRVREIVLVCCAQGGKTTAMQVSTCWALAQQPAPTMVVLQTEDAAKKFARQRLLPMLESCAKLSAQLPEDRHERTTREVLFPNATLMVGPANESFLRAHAIRWLFCDEVSDWRPGLLEQARARTTRYWNRRHWISSTPLEAGSDLERAFAVGDQREWHLGCPACGALIPCKFDSIKWETSEATKPGGRWNFAAMRETVRLVCPSCKAEHQHTAENYRRLNAAGRYVAANPGASPVVVSFRFNALCLPPSALSWADLVEQFLRAKEESNRGYLVPLREFTTLRLAEFWREQDALGVERLDVGNYDPEKDWQDEKLRVLTVDCQLNLEDFWAVVRAWKEDGSSRLLDFKRLSSFSEIEELRTRWNVKPHLTFLDCGYERHRVLAACARHGWAALRGEDMQSYLHTNKDRGNSRRPYSPATKETSGGKPAIVFRWSNPSVKDTTHLLKIGRGAKWEVCDLGPLAEEYARQIDGERKREVRDRLGRPTLRWQKCRDNHAWDCECMQTVAATMAGLFKSETQPPPKPVDSGGV
jgi:hypothetical protein